MFSNHGTCPVDIQSKRLRAKHFTILNIPQLIASWLQNHEFFKQWKDGNLKDHGLLLGPNPEFSLESNHSHGLLCIWNPSRTGRSYAAPQEHSEFPGLLTNS